MCAYLLVKTFKELLRIRLENPWLVKLEGLRDALWTVQQELWQVLWHYSLWVLECLSADSASTKKIRRSGPRMLDCRQLGPH